MVEGANRLFSGYAILEIKARLITQTKMAAYHCCVPQCTNDSRYDRESKLSFHKIPEDNKLRKEWIVKIRRDIGPHFKVCLENGT